MILVLKKNFFLVFERYDNNNISNVQVACENGELEILEVVDVERHDYVNIRITPRIFFKTKIFLETTLPTFTHTGNF
jgi:hypothetical protein